MIGDCADKGLDLIAQHPQSMLAEQYLEAAYKLGIQLYNSVAVSPIAIEQIERIDITQLD